MTAVARSVPVERAGGGPAIPRPSRRQDTPARRLAWAGPFGWVVAGGAVLLYGAALAVGRSSPLGVLVAAIAVAGSAPLFARVARHFPGVEIAGLLRLSLGLKLIATLPRFEIRADSADYHRVGSVLADSFRRLDFTVDTGREIPGTGSVRYLTGLVEVVTFEDEFATFVLFSLLGFAGLVAFVLACRIGVPSVDPVRYGALVLFWPSLLYWPSSIGKEAVVLFTLGVAALGMAVLLQGHLRGLPLTALGLLGCGMVRPHVALIGVTAVVVALIVRAPGRGGLGSITRVLAIGVLLFGGSVASDSVEAIFDIDGLNPTGIAAALDLVNTRSSQGGSGFVAARIDGITEYPWGFVTVMFRPFPHEANSPEMILTSLEALVLIALTVGAVPRLLACLRTIRDEAYIAYAAAFTAVFVYLFSALGNFGILARQRTMTVPLLLVLVALPSAKDRIRRRRLAEVGA